MSDQEARRRSFEAGAAAYESARPSYPDALFDDLVALVHGRCALEIGCGTGKATRPLLSRGFEVVAVEPAPDMARVAREVLRGLPVTVDEARFEAWDPGERRFDLAICAQAFHWVEPEPATRVLDACLASDGWFACFANVASAPIPWKTALYVEHAPELRYDDTWRTIDDHAAAQRERMEAGGRFAVREERRYPWTMRRTADEYIALVDTYSDHRTLDPERRAGLYDALRAAIDARGGVIERDHECYLLLAQRPARAFGV